MRSLISTDLHPFLIIEKQNPLYLNAALVRLRNYEMEGRAVRLVVECRPPRCHTVIELIHSNSIHVLKKVAGRPDMYNPEEVLYIFHHCQEVYREANLQDWYEGEGNIINVQFIAHMEVGNV
jgi:hypothetical protein